jgi:hypothetical protein
MNRKSNEFKFSIEDLGVPEMFAEILPILFNLMALQKKAGSFLPQINLVDLVRQNILPTINKSNTRQLMPRLLAGLHISPENITDEIAERWANLTHMKNLNNHLMSVYGILCYYLE